MEQQNSVPQQPSNNNNKPIPGSLKDLSRFVEPNWMPYFKKHMMKTRYIRLTKQFYDYILADGTFINPKYTRCPAQDLQEPLQQQQVEGLDKDMSFGEMPQFPEIAEQIQSVLSEFDNKLFMKLNWRSPKECAEWMPELKCTHIEDVFMAAKCSEYISELLVDYEDHLTLQSQKPQLYLILRKFQQLHKEMQFRCFISPGHIAIAICQRNCEALYPQLVEQEAKLKDQISQFVKKEILTSPMCQGQKGIVADVYVQGNKVFLVDLGPWRQYTNTLLYTWQQLEDSNSVEFRVVRKQDEILYEDLRNYKIPAEFGENTGNDIMEIIKQLEKQKMQ